ncbi:MAG: hypothetical protein IKX19_07915, partial [Clostridia bacterium]|nr:hypothetical protein [Clostridia bacterium]
LAYGLFGTARKHFENHFHYTRITDGPDKGAFCSTIEDANPGAIAFYNMHQTFLHQARRYWEYSGDGQFAEQLLPVVEGCIERDMRRLKPGDEMLFENCLNTWISDHHWSVMGQCTQASVYLYNIHLLASELSRDPENKAFWRERAEKIKEDLNRVLWQKRKGVFAYAKDLKGYGMLHPEPELADIYHPVELGAADAFQTYQMLDWAEANLDWVRTDNGARMCRSSSWRPNGGNKYSHSIYELNGGEEMNLALAYQEIGLADPAYEIFRFVYMSLYGGRDPGMYDFNYQVGRLRGTPELYTGAALDLPCHLSVNGTSRTNPLFGDTIGMFGREVYEGILGVHPMLQKNEILLAPCIPSEMPHLDMKSALIDYTFDRTDTEIRIRYQVKKSCCTMRFKLFLPVSEVLGVQINGNDAAYTVEPGFGMIAVRTSAENASDGTVEVSFRKADILPTEERRVLSDGDTMELSYPGERIVELIDPQGLFSGVHTEENRLTAQVSAEAGSGVFFLKMRMGKAEYIRPVKVMIREEK